MGKQEGKGVVAIVSSFPFITDGKKECQHHPQYVLRCYLFRSAPIHKIQHLSKYANKKLFTF